MLDINQITDESSGFTYGSVGTVLDCATAPDMLEIRTRYVYVATNKRGSGKWVNVFNSLDAAEHSLDISLQIGDEILYKSWS